MALLVTGGAGFIGSNFISYFLKSKDESIINLDNLTYAATRDNLREFISNPRHHFIERDICNFELVKELLVKFKPRAIVHFAAESHVDRSIENPESFVTTNIVGTFRLLEMAKEYWLKLSETEKHNFRFLHVSTDEVYGSLTSDAMPFTETHPYQPNSPYSASKASSDHLVRAYYHTYHFPILTTHCSNNYGPHQYPEKLIPLAIQRALAGEVIPVYGDGQNIRDWLYVTDHCNALCQVLERGRIGETYNIGGSNEKTNLEVLSSVCDNLEIIAPKNDRQPYYSQIRLIADRPGHDRRYAIDATKIRYELNWFPNFTFEQGINITVKWYYHQFKAVKEKVTEKVC